MRTRGTWLAGMMAALLLVTAALTGCAAFGEPASAEDLLVRFAAKDNKNCAVDAHVDLSLALSGLRVVLPASAHVETADEAAKGTIEADLTSIGGDLQRYELYGESDENDFRVFVHRTDDKAAMWERTEVTSSFSVDTSVLVDLLSDAEFMRVSYEDDDQVRYELTLPAISLVEAVLDMGDIKTSFWEVDRDALADMLKESKLHVCFNKDCQIRSVSLDLDFDYENKELLPVPVKVGIDAEAVVDGYGTIDAPDVAVPEEVRTQSALTDDPFHLSDTADHLMASVS